MTAAAIVCYAILLIIPALMLLTGLNYQKAASTPNAKGGFSEAYIPKTAEAWAYTQNLAGKRIIVFAILTLICGVGFMMLMPFTDLVSLLCCVGIALGIEIVVLLVGLTTIGMALQNHFKTASI